VFKLFNPKYYYYDGFEVIEQIVDILGANTERYEEIGTKSDAADVCEITYNVAKDVYIMYKSHSYLVIFFP
jgi:hypothetical protein